MSMVFQSQGSLEYDEHLQVQNRWGLRKKTDELYRDHLVLRSVPVSDFLKSNDYGFVLPITSIEETKVFKEMRVTALEKGAQSGADAMLIQELAGEMTHAVHALQQRTAKWLVRPYPLGLRFSGINMNPLPCWLSGMQYVCLNM